MPKLTEKEKLSGAQLEAVMQHITRFPDLYYDAFVDIGFVVDVKSYENNLSAIDLNGLTRFFRTFGDDQSLWLQSQTDQYELLNGLAQIIKDTKYLQKNDSVNTTARHIVIPIHDAAMGYIKIAANIDKKANLPVISADGRHKLSVYLQSAEGTAIARYLLEHLSDLECFGQAYASYRNSVLNYNKDKLLRSSNFRAGSFLNERLDLLERISEEQSAKEYILKYEQYLAALLSDPKAEVQDMFCELSMMMYLEKSKNAGFFERSLGKLITKIKQRVTEEFPDAVDAYTKLALFYQSRLPLDMRQAIVNYYKTVDQPKILDGLENINLALEQAYKQREQVNSTLDIFELMQDYTKLHSMVQKVSDQKQNPNILTIGKIKTQAELSTALLCIVNEFEHRCENLLESLDTQLQVLRDKGVTFDAFSAQVKVIEGKSLIEGTALDNLRILQEKLSSNRHKDKLS